MALITLKASQKAKKEKDLGLMKEALKGAKAVYLSDYRGMTMTALSELRDKLGEKGTYMVVKNTIFAKAVAESGMGTVDPESFKGPSAALFSYEDEVGPLKLLVDFAKKNNDLPNVKAGVLEGQFLNEAKVQALAKLPGKDQLRGQVVGALAAPLTGLVSVLNGNIRNLVYVLGQVQEKRANA